MDNEIINEDIIYKKIDNMSIGDKIIINDLEIVYDNFGIKIYYNQKFLEIFSGQGCFRNAARFICNIDIKEFLHIEELRQKFFKDLFARISHGIIYHLVWYDGIGDTIRDSGSSTSRWEPMPRELADNWCNENNITFEELFKYM